MLSKIKKNIDSIKNDALLSPTDAVKLGLSPSVFQFYRLLKAGHLPVVNIGSGGAPRYRVRGADLKKFMRERYVFVSQGIVYKSLADKKKQRETTKLLLAIKYQKKVKK